MPEFLTTFVTSARVLAFLRAATTLILGLVLARLLSANLVRFLTRRISPQQSMLASRIIYSAVAGLAVVSALREMGFDLSVLLGAAGILTVAIGFASQTSASNLISGLFLIFERPFVVGDIIKVGDTTGEVLSIDLLSVKLRTFDNLFVRVPNESVVKSQITNMTHFPIRRLDLQFGVAYKESIGKVRDVLMKVADANPLCLEDPKPIFIFLGFGDSALNIQFSVWAKRESFLELRNSLQEEIKKAFDCDGIEIPFPQRTLHAASTTAPLPIRIVEGPGLNS